MLNSHITPFPLHYVSVYDSKNATCPRISRNKLNCSRPEMGVLSVAVFLSRRRGGGAAGLLAAGALSRRVKQTPARGAPPIVAHLFAPNETPRGVRGALDPARRRLIRSATLVARNRPRWAIFAVLAGGG